MKRVSNGLEVHEIIGRVATRPMKGKPEECLRDETCISHHPGDVYLVTYPKTGTTLLQFLCHLLRTNGNHEDFEDIHQVVPHTSSSWFIGQDLNLPQPGAPPRLFKSHRMLDQIAPFSPVKLKFIATIRDPMQTLISLHSFRMQRGQKQSANLLEFASSDVWQKENNPGCVFSVFDHFRQFWQAKECENILLLPYEDLVEEKERWVPLIAEFLGISHPMTPELLEKILTKTSREWMLKNVSKFDESWTRRQRGCLGRVHATVGEGIAAKVNKEEAHKETTATFTAEDERKLCELQQRLWMGKIFPSTGLRSYEEMRKQLVEYHFPPSNSK